MSTSSIKNRVIVLVDMDCFYVQVVQRKNPTLYGKPCAVVQYQTWRGGGIIAVGYEARKFGVTRQMRGDEAKKKCPEITLVHVPENRGKADLTQFREAGAEVILVLAEFTDALERASIDEAYLDLTNVIESQLSKYTVEEVALSTFKTTNIVGLDNKDVPLTDDSEILQCDLYKQWLHSLKNNTHNYYLAIGAVIADEMRRTVQQKTGFSCSAGVGQNKMLAKIVAGFHKPNQQTVIFQEHVEEMFKTTKMRKIRSLGGKLGQQLEDKFKAVFMSELCPIPLKELQNLVGMKSGELVFWLCRGVDHEPVRVRSLPQSVGCSKNFMGKLKLKTKNDVYSWLSNLSEEVSERLEKERTQNNRIASLFTVGCTNENKISQSRRCSIVRMTHQTILEEAYKALQEFNKSHAEDWCPALVNISLTASKFQHIQQSGNKNINSYMKNTTTSLSTSSNSSVDSLRNEAVSTNERSVEKTSITNFFQAALLRNNSIKQTYSTDHSLGQESSNNKCCSIKESNTEKNSSKDYKMFKVSNSIASLTCGSDENPLAVFYRNPPSSNKDDMSLPKNTDDEISSHCSFKSSEEEDSENPLPSINEMKSNKNDTQNKRSSNDLLETFGCDSTQSSNNESPKVSSELTTFGNSDYDNKIKSNFDNFTNNEQETNNSNIDYTSKINSSYSNHTSKINSSYSNEHKETNKKRKSFQLEEVCEDNEKTIISSQYKSSLNDLMNCEECGKRMLAWDLPDHMDFHFAKQVQDSMRNEFVNLYSNKGGTSQPKKKTKLENSFRKYFSPKDS